MPADAHATGRRSASSALTDPPRLPIIAPSILAADAGRLGEECRGALAAGGDVLHYDVMDGHLVPNLALGVDLLGSLKASLPGAFFDVHLMIERPDLFVRPFAQAGAGHLTFHVEAPGARDGRALIDRIRELGMSAGVAIDGPTPADRALPLLEHADLVLVMSIRAGFAGQTFDLAALDKIAWVRERVGEGTRVEVDGGVGPAQAPRCLRAGADTLAAASAVFGVPQESRASVIAAMRGAS